MYDGIKPAKPIGQGGNGAWELAVRISELDLNDGDFLLRNNQWMRDINGGRERNATFAINWYLNNYLRTGFNYVHVMELSGGSYAYTNLDAVQVRMQLAF